MWKWKQEILTIKIRLATLRTVVEFTVKQTQFYVSKAGDIYLVISDSIFYIQKDYFIFTENYSIYLELFDLPTNFISWIFTWKHVND